MLRTVWALFVARNKEFYRDRGTLGWNFAFPFMVIFGLALVFSGGDRDLYKVGLLGASADMLAQATAPAGTGVYAGGSAASAPATGAASAAISAPASTPATGAGGGSSNSAATVRAFMKTRYVQFVPVAQREAALDKVRHHQFDMVLDTGLDTGRAAGRSPTYWVNPSNPKGYALERMLRAAAYSTSPGAAAALDGALTRQELDGRQIRYVDWLLPGVLGMNMMFSSLFGLGYVIVRYRKGGILRRFKAAPLSAVEFLSAQMISRLVLVLLTTAVVYFGADLVLGFFQRGSTLSLFLVFALGALCMNALSLMICARTASLELSGGLLNMATWPMMFLSGVWFSMEGSPEWLVMLSKALPLTHMIDAARAIMVDGASLAEVAPQLTILAVMSAVFLAVGAFFFRWE